MPPPPVPASALASSSKVEPSSSAVSEDRDERKKKAEELFSKKRLGEGELKLDKRKLAEAIREERDRKRKGRSEDDDPWGKGKKKKTTDEVTEEELGAFCLFYAVAYVPDILYRGVPYESSNDRGSYGQLRGRGSVMCSPFYLSSLLYTYAILPHCNSLCIRPMRRRVLSFKFHAIVIATTVCRTSDLKILSCT